MMIARSHTRHLRGFLLIALAIVLMGCWTHANGKARHLVPMFPAEADQFHQGVVRIINHSPRSGKIQIVAVDAGGSSFGPTTLTIEADETVHFNSADLENGNAAKGLSNGTGPSDGIRVRITAGSTKKQGLEVGHDL